MTTRGVLITGSHRSGSTWLGRLLAAADGLHYVHEPFNIVARVRWTAHPPPHQFLYVCADNADGWARELDQAMALRLPVAAQIVTSLRHGRARRLARMAHQARQARGLGHRPLVKDPIALFSTAWLAERFELDPVILVRNPVSFVGSLKERNWSFDFNHWADQPLLMEHLLHDYRDAILAQARQPGSIVDQGILQWNAMYSVVDRFRRDHPDWMVLRYEDLAAAPGQEIPQIYQRLGLTFGPDQQRRLRELTERGDGRGTAAMDLRRDSRAAMETWRDRLDPGEVDTINRGTAAVTELFYPAAPNR